MKLNIYLRTLLAGGAIILGTENSFAQYVTKDTYMDTSGVSNEGVVAGYVDWAGPYYLWNPDENTETQINGAAPGNGVGGQAHFSSDGNYLSGSNFVELPINTDWQRNTYSDYPYIYMNIEFPDNQANLGFAAGQSVTYNGNGAVIKTVDGGNTWEPIWTDTEQRGIEAMSFPNSYTGYVGGWNGYFAKTFDGGYSWQEQNPAGDDDIYFYTAIKFKDYDNGVVGAQLSESMAVYVTSDGGTTWTTASGLEGIPSKIEYVSGDTYFLTTYGGQVQKSTDNGLTWTTVLSVPGNAFFSGISFYDEMTGFVMGESEGAGVYKTTNGGNSWTEVDIFGTTGGYAIWRDLAFVSQDHLFITGTPDMIYESLDGGNTWTWSNEDLFDGNPALYAVTVAGNNVHISGSQGTFYKKSLISSQTVAEMSRYDVSTGEWTALGNLGMVVDNSVSAGYDISEDGKTVVGNAYINTGSTNGFAWNEDEGIIDLGSMHADRSARANAVSGDGSVIVGWQDFNGPWKSAVWYKNPDGGYFPNHYLLVDENGDPDDEYNQLGEARAVSADGNWIGGSGDYAFQNAWIWSEETGLIDLGNAGAAEGAIGYVSAINEDGSIVVGWYQSGGGPWDPPVYTPFIWTPENGAQNLNTYVTEVLEYDLGGDQIFVPTDMSSNGKYISGWSFNPSPDPWGEYHTFRIQLSEGIGNDECDGAIALSCGDTATGSTVTASDSGGNTSNDVFYSFTGDGTEQLVTLSLCGSDYDTYIRVFSDCTLTNEITGNDDGSNCPEYQSEVSFTSDGTSTYIIMVEGYSGFSDASGDFELSVICEELSTNDLNSFDFSYHPNPVKDILNISTKKSVKKVEIFNMAGQKVMSDAKVSNGQINVNSLTPGTYVFKVTLKGGQIETFKIIKK